jgi:hypothetical protein
VYVSVEEPEDLVFQILEAMVVMGVVLHFWVEAWVYPAVLHRQVVLGRTLAVEHPIDPQ